MTSGKLVVHRVGRWSVLIALMSVLVLGQLVASASGPGGSSVAQATDGPTISLDPSIGPCAVDSSPVIVTGSGFAPNVSLNFILTRDRDGEITAANGSSGGPPSEPDGTTVREIPLIGCDPSEPGGSTFTIELIEYYPNREGDLFGARASAVFTVAGTLSGAFLDTWEGGGGLPVFGWALTDDLIEQNTDTDQDLTVQYLERQRFELHPEKANTPYEVLLGRLGVELLESQGRDWRAFPQASPTQPHYVPETGHAIDPEFWPYWSSHGLDLGDEGVSFRESVALFGYPVSQPMMERNGDGDVVLTQYFERAVFELHPDNSPAYQVLLRRLGAEILALENGG